MNDTALALFNLSQDMFWHGAAVFLRVGAAMAVLPAFGEQSVPARVKLALAFVFTLVVAPSLATPIGTERDLLSFGWLAVSEAGVGLALGIGVRMFIFALQVAGSMAAQATSLSQLLGSAGAEPLPAMGHLLVVAGLALAVLTGLHVRVAELLILSYEVFPAGRMPEAGALSEWGIAQVARAFSLAFSLAAPFVIMSVLYNLTLGVINRAMPQLMVAFVGAPVITAGGLFLLFLVSPFLLSVWIEAFNGFLASPVGGR
ncbi:flagellar biosynthetic protein FliR [Salinihabitans flavidus]|uniref:Flagellar biosynthetic protein FliR n=1 Tax=Salinihabitans flavidus TaxID=569882 RepID=A0A1H8LQZ3_9RHOB|nr:flagellar biosynthetic protein FliR [Salinihabitans flavidus]SEO07504.1 flagellar biosynthetic protein FliR [Salinihabitans flavidus]